MLEVRQCAYCGAGWTHLQTTDICCNIGKKAVYLYLNCKSLNLTIKQKEEIQIWLGPSLIDKREWKELVKKRGGNIIFAGRSALLNLLNDIYLSEEDIQWLIEHGANLDNEINKDCYFESRFGIKYSKESIFELFASIVYESEIMEVITSRLWNGYLPNLSLTLYEVVPIDKNQNKVKIGNFYMCQGIWEIHKIFNLNLDGTYSKDEIEKSYQCGLAEPIPVIALDEAIGYDGQLCIRIRYLYKESIYMPLRSYYDEVCSSIFFFL